ncbi:hypothetical protein [Devosia sp. CN2-171]|uniref:hypothetical protein n=1 Tax=Devosia sp. CN2-171 TaxID=3400909 RepID=UPI003BF91EEE
MSLDPIVWLIAGIGIGVGASLMLLMLYAGLERWRLGRRLRRVRVLRDVPPPPEMRPPAPPGSKLALLDRKAEPREMPATGPVDAKRATAIVEPAVAMATKAEPGVLPVPFPAAVRSEPETPPTVDAAPAVVVEVKPEVPAPPVTPFTPPSPPPAVTTIASPPRPPQSVEDMFAEAFALDKVSVAPLTKDEAS